MPKSFSRDGAPARILVAQPRKSYLSVIARRIAEAGFRVAAAETVQAAVAELYRAPVDLVVAELDGPGFCGKELVSIIRTDAVLRDLPVLLFTGRSDRGAAVRALQVGADGIVAKPFHFDVLCARIARELERKRAIDDLRQDNQMLDARIIERAMEMGELKDRLAASETERRRLAEMVRSPR